MRPVDIDVARSMVCASVCRLHRYAMQKGRTDQDAIWGLTHVGPMNHVFDGSRSDESIPYSLLPFYFGHLLFNRPSFFHIALV